MTCEACPSQWEGITDDGQEVYIRYRWGHLSVRVNGAEIFSRQIGDGFDGVLTTTDMLAITGIRESQYEPIKFYVFQDPAGEWQVWNETTYRVTENNHRLIKQRSSGNDYSIKMLDCLAKSVMVYTESAQEAIEKGKAQ